MSVKWSTREKHEMGSEFDCCLIMRVRLYYFVFFTVLMTAVKI
jgi:hypothetical protein